MSESEKISLNVDEEKLVEWIKQQNKPCSSSSINELRTTVQAYMQPYVKDNYASKWLWINAVASFQISMKLLNHAVPRLFDIHHHFNELGIHVDVKTFSKLVVENERIILNTCNFEFLYMTTDKDGNEEHLHHLVGLGFEDNTGRFIDVACDAMEQSCSFAQVCMRRQWQVVQVLCRMYDVERSIAFHAMLTVVFAWFRMDVWKNSL